MRAAGVPIRPTTVPFAKFTAPATIPVPATRAPVDGVAVNAGGRREGAGDLPRSPLGGGAAGRELPDGLIAGAVRGDRRAREELLALIHPRVLRYCRARMGYRESVLCSADDVAQDVCVAVVGALQTYQLRGLSFRAFVYGIAAHKVADAFRASGRDRTEPVDELPDSPVSTDGPEQRMLAAERTAHLEALLAHLTPRQREVLLLRLAVGMSAEETAQAVGSTAGAVRVTQHRALSRLRRIIQQGKSAGVVQPTSAEAAPESAHEAI